MMDVDFANVAGLIFTDLGSIRIRRGKIRSITIDMNLKTPIEALQDLPWLKPKYVHNVLIVIKSGTELRFSSDSLLVSIDRRQSRFKLDISVDPFAACDAPIGIIKVRRVLLWESKSVKADPSSIGQTPPPLDDGKPWPQDPLDPIGS